MRSVQISGYVQKDIKRTETATRFQISNYKGKRDDKAEYQYVTISVRDSQFQVSEGDRVIVYGELDIFKYNEKYYTQVVAFKENVGIIYGDNSKQAKSESDEIPF